MIIRKAMYGCGLNFFIKLAYNSLFLYKFAWGLAENHKVFFEKFSECRSQLPQNTQNSL